MLSQPKTRSENGSSEPDRATRRRRPDDWFAKLSQVVGDYGDDASDPFDLVTAAIAAITDEDVKFPKDGTMHERLSAKLPLVPNALMARGDICLMSYDGHEYVGVNLGGGVFSTGGPQGNIMLTRRQVAEVFAV